MIRAPFVAAVFAAALAVSATASAPPAFAEEGEALPPGAPSDSYELAAWCYGALSEYLIVYDKVVPDLKDIDRMFGTSVKEDTPYKHDMAAARTELKMIADAVTDAEKASPQPLTAKGLAAINDGRSIWSVAESKTQRELARAWLMWALPDQCDVNARDLARRSLLLGGALKYNQGATPAADTDQTAAPKPPQPPADQPDAIDAFLAQQAKAGDAQAQAATQTTAEGQSAQAAPVQDAAAQTPPVQTPPAQTPPAQDPAPPPTQTTDTPPSPPADTATPAQQPTDASTKPAGPSS